MATETKETGWETDVAGLLDELSDVQSELLEVLQAKRECMASNDAKGMVELHPRTEMLCDRLRSCHDRREELLAQAKQRGLPSETLTRLAGALPPKQRGKIQKRVKEASSRMRLLQHHSLANWVLAQRTVLHLSQLLEIIATGGQLQPTYSRDETLESRGALVDKEV
jgi:flagellar biosynthesis/type III secretory pathway chaperone